MDGKVQAQNGEPKHYAGAECDCAIAVTIVALFTNHHLDENNYAQTENVLIGAHSNSWRIVLWQMD